MNLKTKIIILFLSMHTCMAKPTVYAEYLNCDYKCLNYAGSTIFIAGSSNSILRSIDQGVTWEKCRTNSFAQNESYQSICSYYDHIIAVSDKGFVNCSSDNGNSWSGNKQITSVKLNSCQFVNNGTAFAFGNSGAIFSSSDYGATWNSSSSNKINSSIITSICTDNGYLIVFCGDGNMFLSGDQGREWNQINLNRSSFTGLNFEKDNSGNVYLFSDKYIFKSTDNGLSWTSNEIQGNSIRYGSIIRPGKALLIDSVNIKQIDFSTGSQNISEIDTNFYPLTDNLLSAIKHFDDRIVFAIGNYNTILKSTDGGLSWNIISYLNAFKRRFNYLAFMNDSVGYCSSYRMLIYKTVDIGATWKPITPLSLRIIYNSINEVHLSGNRFVAVDDWHRIFITENDFNTFRFDTVRDKSANIFHFLKFDDSVFIYENYNGTADVSLQFRILEGKMINRVNLSVSNLRLFKALDSGIHGFAQYFKYKKIDTTVKKISYSNYFFTNDYCSSMSLVEFENISMPLSIFFVNDKLGYLSGLIGTDDGLKGSYYKTTDGGFNWLLRDSVALFAISQTGQGTAFAYNEIKKKIVYSIDNCDSWSTVPLDYQLIYTNSLVTTNNYCYFSANITDYWPVLARITVGKDDVEVEDKTEARNYLYFFPPFPVPAKTEVRANIYWDMSLDIDKDELGVYDIYGMKIGSREDVRIEKTNGYSGYLVWNCSSAPDGIYFVRLRHGDRTQSLKVMVGR